MEDRFAISLLLDFYGELLTEKQKKIMDLYYNEDFSLAEIAEINETSRQAIHDTIKRCYKLLMTYETKLKLLEKSLRLSSDIKIICDKLENLQKGFDSTEENYIEIENIKNILLKDINI
ncbi:putative DNA-binding protein [Clostridium amazonitimonense]|uniref:putative DNA-binding protein n=1 Tax=Clostridium amazonitimonense TaxID=1499689 RepID=UPI000509869D|nr:putative DNA-binding protein [Clostridium amazonitimonense]